MAEEPIHTKVLEGNRKLHYSVRERLIYSFSFPQALFASAFFLRIFHIMKEPFHIYYIVGPACKLEKCDQKFF